MKKSYKRGFTLIELLVVIAIIGILASIILASLATARSKGNNAAIQSQLQSIQQQAELDNSAGYYSYPAGGTAITTAITSACPTSGTSVFVDPQIQNILTQTAKNSGGGYVACAQPIGGASWVVAAQLATDKALAWCTDSTGNSKQEGTAGGTAIASVAALATLAFSSSNTCN